MYTLCFSFHYLFRCCPFVYASALNRHHLDFSSVATGFFSTFRYLQSFPAPALDIRSLFASIDNYVVLTLTILISKDYSGKYG